MNKKLHQAVNIEQIRQLYSNTKFSLFASLFIAPLLTLALWQELQNMPLLIWLVAVILLTAVRYYLTYQYMQSQERLSERMWLRLFLAGTFMAGLTWGQMAWLFSASMDLDHWFLVLFILVGLSGGALASLSAYYFAYILFVVPAFLPMMIQLFKSDIHDNSLMAVMILLFIVLTTLLARRSNQYINKTIILRIEREAMSNSIENQIATVAAQHERILETQTNLRRVNELFEAAFDTTHVMYAYLDNNFNFMRVNKAYAEKGNLKPEDFIGKNHFTLYPDEENKKIFEQVRDAGKGFFAEEKFFVHPEQGETYWDWSLEPLLGPEGEVIGLLLAIIDVTAKKQAQIAMQEKEEYLQSIMDAAIEVILTMDAKGTIEMVNPAVEQMFGYQQDELTGKNISLLMPDAIAEMHQYWVDNYLNSPDKKISGRQLDTEGKRKDGSTFPLSVSVSDKVINGKHMFTSIMRDITEQHNVLDSLKIKNTELEYLSSHDDLTGLHNRRTGDEFLQREWNRAVRAKTSITIMMIDIDYFKKYNDRYGHQAGDACLLRVATTMKLVLNRPSDMVARYGGEEFIAILPETDSVGALQVAENIRKSINDLEIPHSESDKEVVTVSIGIGTAQPVKLMNYEKLVSCADKALYQAKGQGRNCVVMSGDKIQPEADV